jgi:catechol 2,3-dioxygenase-like lactoylglutathione lyase family enzyme
MRMIIGAHTIIYSKDAEADRAFLRDVLGFADVDAGSAWLVFALPPGELAVHPSDENDVHELYLMTDDLASEIGRLTEKGVACDSVSEQRWGSLTALRLPGGGKVGLYQPRHPIAIKGV